MAEEPGAPDTAGAGEAEGGLRGQEGRKSRWSCHLLPRLGFKGGVTEDREVPVSLRKSVFARPRSRSAAGCLHLKSSTPSA